jgi:AraC family transcriptional regulator
VRRTTEYLREHLDKVVSLADLAELSNLSPVHFSRAFKRSLGTPPHAFRCSLRLAEAKRLLVETDLSITDISLAVGYEAPQTLARVFQREVWQSPTALRREHRLRPM